MPNSTLLTAGRLGTAAAGGIIAGPIGFAVGSLVGGLLFGGGPDVEGPQLDDLDVSSSSYGTAIPRGYGLAKITGTVIWATDIIEKKSTEKHGGFFGVGGTKVTTYRYFANLAVAFGEGPATEIPRLWAGDKLLRDQGFYDTGEGVLIGGKVAASPHHLAGLRIRSYLGTGDQEPDPLIAKSVEKETGEADATPAHRGLVYVVLENLPLEDFGNRIPPVTAEVNWRGDSAQPRTEVTLLSGQTLDDVTFNSAAFDWHRKRIFFRGSNSSGDRGIRRVRLTDLVEDQQRVTTPDASPIPWVVTRRGQVLAEAHTGSNSAPFHLFDGDSLRLLDTFGVSSSGLGHTLERFQNARHVAYVQLVDAFGTSRDRFLHTGVVGSIGILEATLGQLVALWTGTNPDSRLAPADPLTATGGPLEPGRADCWWVGDNSGSLRFLRIQLGSAIQVVIDESGDWDTWGLTHQQVIDVDPTDVEAGASDITVDSEGGIVFVPALEGVAVMVSMDTGNKFLLVLDASGLVKSVKLGITQTPNFSQASLVNSTEIALQHGSRVEIVDLGIGKVVYSTEWPSAGPYTRQLRSYDALTDSLYSVGNGFHRLFLRRSSNSVHLSEVVSDLCATAGLTPSELGTSELTDRVRGFVLAKQMPYRKALELLAATYLFDVVESDFRLVFKKRGRPVTRVIHEDDLVPVGERETFVEERAQDVELPLRFSVVYRDVERDGDRGVQSVQRVSNPDATMRSRNEASLELPLALTPGEAVRSRTTWRVEIATPRLPRNAVIRSAVTWPW